MRLQRGQPPAHISDYETGLAVSCTYARNVWYRFRETGSVATHQGHRSRRRRGHRDRAPYVVVALLSTAAPTPPQRARRQLVDAQLAAHVLLLEAAVHSQALGARRVPRAARRQRGACQGRGRERATSWPPSADSSTRWRRTGAATGTTATRRSRCSRSARLLASKSEPHAQLAHVSSQLEASMLSEASMRHRRAARSASRRTGEARARLAGAWASQREVLARSTDS